VKAQNNLYTTIGNTTWFQRGAAALTVLLLVAAGVSLTLWTLPTAQVPAVAPAAPAADSLIAPGGRTASPYDGSAYVEYLTADQPAVNPNVPAIGTGSAYDGRSYGGAPAAPAAVNPNVPAIGTGSAYDGRSYGGARPAAPVQPSCLGINLPTGADMGEVTRGMNDYVRRCSYGAAQAQPAAPAQPLAQIRSDCYGVELPTGTDMSEISSGMWDYVLQCSQQQSAAAQPSGPAASTRSSTDRIDGAEYRLL
jgi:hypothetical protein